MNQFSYIRSSTALYCTVLSQLRPVDLWASTVLAGLTRTKETKQKTPLSNVARGQKSLEFPMQGTGESCLQAGEALSKRALLAAPLPLHLPRYFTGIRNLRPAGMACLSLFFFLSATFFYRHSSLGQEGIRWIRQWSVLGLANVRAEKKSVEDNERGKCNGVDGGWGKEWMDVARIVYAQTFGAGKKRKKR